MNGQRTSSSLRGPRSYILLFLFLSAVYHSNLRPVASGDSLAASLIPFSILLDGSIALDRFGPYVNEHVPYASSVVHRTGKHWYSAYPVGGPVLATPLYIPIAFIPWIRHQPPGPLIAIARIAEKVTAVAFSAGSAVALLLLLQRLTFERAAWILTLVFALATGNWSTSSQAMWQHTFGQPAIIGCLYAMHRWNAPDATSRWYWIAGVCAAFALAIRPTNLALLPALAVALWVQRARPADGVRVFAPPIVAGFLIAAYNVTVFQRLAGGYPLSLEGHWVQGLLGILFSPARGLLVYTPIAIFALLAFAPKARASRDRNRPMVAAASVFSILHIASIALWPAWWGGYCWGPRLLTEVLPCVMVLIAIGLPAIELGGRKQAFAAAIVYCTLIQALGVYCYPKGRWDSQPISVDVDPGRLWNWEDNPIVRTASGGVAWEPYAIVAAAVRGGWPAAASRLQQLGIKTY